MAIAEVFRHLRRTAVLSAGLTDGQLLECYLTRQEEAAFEALVRQHGPMVLGVCRRVLRNEHDAEDAFQATFLVLLRKASCILPRDRVGNWLYGVAYRTSLKAKAMRAKRRAKERQVTRPETDQTWLELLDYELNRLPDKYREPVVLCHLQGKTRREAARILGWPEGTVATRLTTARRILAKRLRGSIAIPIASVPPVLVASTVRAGQIAISANVAALTGAVLKGMLMGKVKIVMAMAIVFSAIGLGVGAGSYQLLAGEEDRKAPPTEPKATAKEPTKEEKADGRLPISPPPYQVLVSLAKNGRLAVKTVTLIRKQTPALTSDGRSVASYRPDHLLATSHYDLGDIEVFDSKGKKVDKERLPELLKVEIPALLYSSQEKLDPLHLRLIKEGTLVFVLPHSEATPAPAPTIAAPPQGEPFGGTPESQDRLITVAHTLKRVSATRVSILLSNFYKQRYQDVSVAQKHVGITVVDNSNTVVVTAAPKDLEEIRRLIELIDNPTANGQLGPDLRVGQVLILGNEKTSDVLISKAIQLSPGQDLTGASLRKAEHHLIRLNLFESATVTVVETQGAFKDVLVTVKEK
jgi:RNA polymerase sigma factor (sigma-70 family)